MSSYHRGIFHVRIFKARSYINWFWQTFFMKTLEKNKTRKISKNHKKKILNPEAQLCFSQKHTLHFSILGKHSSWKHKLCFLPFLRKYICAFFFLFRKHKCAFRWSTTWTSRESRTLFSLFEKYNYGSRVSTGCAFSLFKKYNHASHEKAQL